MPDIQVNNQYFDLMNLEHCFSACGVHYDPSYLRWVKDIIITKISMFRYEGLKEYGIKDGLVERALMFRSHLCGYLDKTLGFVICYWRQGSDFDLYYQPKRVELMSFFGKVIAQNVDFDDIVLLRDNPLDLIPFLTLNNWIEKCMEKEKTLESIFDWLSMPLMLTGDKSQVATFKNVFKKAKAREPFMATSKGFSDHLEAFNINLPAELEDILKIIKYYKAMAVQSMGIYQADDKRERMITGEVEAANDYVDFVYTGMYEERKHFVDNCNEKFGTNIKLVETYVANQNDSIALAKKRAMAEGAPQIAIEKIKAEAAKQEVNNVQRNLHNES